MLIYSQCKYLNCLMRYLNINHSCMFAFVDSFVVCVDFVNVTP